MPIIEVNGQELEFPDTMSEAEILTVLRQKFPTSAADATGVPQVAPVQPQVTAPQAQVAPTPTGDGMDALRALTFGATQAVPFGSKITSGIGAVGAKVADVLTGGEATEGLSVPELFEIAQQQTRETQEEHPFASATGNVAGAIATLPIGMSTKVGQLITKGVAPNAVSNLGRLANTLSKIGVGAGSGAAAGAIYGAGEALPGEIMKGIEDGAITGATFGAAIPTATAFMKGGRTAITGMLARNSDELGIARDTMHKLSSGLYKKARSMGAVLNEKAVNNVSDDIAKALTRTGKMNPELHKKTLSVLSQFQDDAVGTNVSLEELDQYRKLLSKVAGGKAGEDATFATAAINAIDDAVDGFSGKDLVAGAEGAFQAFDDARQQWGKFKRFETISDIIRKADQNPNKIKSGLKTFVNKRKNLRGFSPEEVKALHDASRFTAGEGTLKAIGKFGFDFGGTTGNMALPAIASSIGAGGVAIGSGVGTAAIPIVAAGTIARPLQRGIASGKAENLLKLIEAGGIR